MEYGDDVLLWVDTIPKKDEVASFDYLLPISWGYEYCLPDDITNVYNPEEHMGMDNRRECFKSRGNSRYQDVNGDSVYSSSAIESYLIYIQLLKENYFQYLSFGSVDTYWNSGSCHSESLLS